MKILVICAAFLTVASAVGQVNPGPQPAKDSVATLQRELAEKDLTIARQQSKINELTMELNVATSDQVIAQRAADNASIKKAADAFVVAQKAESDAAPKPKPK